MIQCKLGIGLYNVYTRLQHGKGTSILYFKKTKNVWSKKNVTAFHEKKNSNILSLKKILSEGKKAPQGASVGLQVLDYGVMNLIVACTHARMK